MKIFLSLVLLSFGLLLTGCQTGPKRFSDETEGQWQAKVLVRDAKVGRSQIVNMNVQAVNQSRLRMDITAALGHHVASLVLRKDQVEYLLTSEKKFYSGRSNENALRPILALPLNPQLLYNVLFDLPIEEKGWTCTKDQKDFIADCKNLSSGLEIKWSERKGRRKTVHITHQLGAIQMNFMAYKPKVEGADSQFDLVSPQGFQQQKIR